MTYAAYSFPILANIVRNTGDSSCEKLEMEEETAYLSVTVKMR